jgi:hypothetical protein
LPLKAGYAWMVAMILASSAPALASDNKFPLDQAELTIAIGALGKPLSHCTSKEKNPCWVKKFTIVKTTSLEDRFGFEYSLENGIVDEISIKTAGVRFEDRELQMLMKLFGRPSDIKEAEVQNLFGAKFSNIEATWNEATTRAVDFSDNPGPSLPIYVKINTCCWDEYDPKITEGLLIIFIRDKNQTTHVEYR